MFNEQNFDTVGFDSSWKNEKVVENQSIQTTEFSAQEKSVNTTLSKSIEIQTDPVTCNLGDGDVDMEKLAIWLKNIYPKVVNELNDNSLTSAMATCNSLTPASSLTVTMLQKVNTIDESYKNDNEKQGMFISALSWNCTGNTIAVSCSLKHDIWCYHQGEVRLYSFIRNEKLPDIPSKKLICGACVTSLSFHPSQPSILSAGTVSGEVYLWNIQNDGDSLLSSNTGHDDRISMVAWVTTADTKPSTVLITAALDSNLVLWKINDSILNIDQRFKPQHYTHKVYTSSLDIIPKKTERGIVHFDFSPHIPGLFVVGIEGGFVLKCSLLGARQVPGKYFTDLSGNKTSSAILDPYMSSFSGHDGEVTNISFSPHRKDLFFSSGTDDQIRIFNIDQESPVQIIFVNITLSSVAWIQCESKLLIGGSEDGSLRIFSLLNGQPIPTNTTFTSQAVTAMAVNNKRVNMLAIGNNEGILQLWSFPWNNIAAQDNINVSRKNH